MNNQFTPGPWVTGDDHPSVCRMTDTGSQQICAMDTAGFAVGEPQANARLIAAAPELLDALQTLVRQIERDNLHTTQGVSISKARQAIAKAARME